MTSRRYVLIAPCRDESKFMRRTLDALERQTVLPALCVVVDDGSTDDTPRILEQYAGRLPWLRIVTRANRGKRAVGPGVIEAFYAGLETVDLDDYDYVCKLDLDLDFEPRYFETLIERMEAEPRLGTFSGKPWVELNGQRVPEPSGDEMSVGMSKFYRVDCFRQIGGFVREVMWDGIDCHRVRLLGWLAGSSDAVEDLRIAHLRPMGSSQVGIHVGRQRHGFGQWFMGTGPLYMAASSALRMLHPPYLSGGLSMFWGYVQAWRRKAPRYADLRFRRFLRRCQWLMLTRGKSAAMRQVAQEQAWAFDPRREAVPMGAAPVPELPLRLPGLPVAERKGLPLHAADAAQCAQRIADERSAGRGGWLQLFDDIALKRYFDQDAYAQLVQGASLVPGPAFDAQAMLRQWVARTPQDLVVLSHGATVTADWARGLAAPLHLERWTFDTREQALSLARARLAAQPDALVVSLLESPQQEWLVNALVREFPRAWFLALGPRAGAR